MKKAPLPQKITWFPGRTMLGIQLDALEFTLDHFNGNKTHAAQALDISLRTVTNWIRAHDRLARFRKPRSGSPEHEEECDE